MPTPSPLPSSAHEPWSDAQVIARVCSGEAQLFELLMRRYNERVYRSVRSILRDEASVEDVMQSAWLHAFAQLAGFEARASFATWLTRIAINEALAERRRGLRTVAQDGATLSELPSPGRDPAASAQDQEDRRLLVRAVDALPEHFRTVFILREVQELSVEETARCLALTGATVKTRLHRARVLLRRTLLEQLEPSLGTLLPFQAPRCDRVVAAVLARIVPR